MIIHNYNGAGASLDIPVNDRSYRLRQIMGEDSMYLYFSLPEYIDIKVGAYVDYQGLRYYLHKPDNFKKHHTRNYEHSLTLTGDVGSLVKYKIRDVAEKRLKFPLTAKPQQHLQMLIDNLNAREPGWTMGSCIDAGEKLISYNHNNLLEALQMMADAFETEWEVKNKVIHLRKVEYNHDNPLALAYGKGKGFKPGLGRSNVDDKTAIEILHVQGGVRNIDYSKYESKELLLPAGQNYTYEGRVYKASADGLSIQRADKLIVTGVEDSLDLTNIYPQREGAVSLVTVIDAAKHFYDFADSSIPAALDYEACRITGEKMTIVFQTGLLAGREFDIDSYVHSSRTFKIVPAEQDGLMLPDSVFKPAIGDKYAVFGIHLPQAYIRNDATQEGASWDMFKEGVRHLYEHETPRFTFTGELDGIWAKQDWFNIGGKIVLGGYVHFSDDNFLQEGTLIRIVGVKDYLNNPHSPEIDLSNNVVSSAFASQMAKIKQNEVVSEDLHRQSISYAKRRYRDSIETLEMLQAAFRDSFTNAVSPVTVKTMALLVGDESLQFRFVNNMTTPVEVTHVVTYNSSTKILNAPAGIIQHMTLGLSSIAPVHKANEYKFWDVANFNTPPLTDPAKSYYLYIKASKASSNAVFYISENPIGLEAVTGFYHFLMGVLNAEDEDDRSYVSLYGFSEVLPGRVTTNKIVSADGDTFIDLQTGDIQGKFKFTSGQSVEDAIVDQQIYVEYSVNGSTDWHTTFTAGDLYMRQKKGAGNWSSAIRLVGIDGTSGTDGRSVSGMTTEFYLSTSKTTQTGGSWVTEPPTWVNGKYLWTRVKIDYINPASTAYTTPSVSSEWEAVNDLEIGGRNLVEKTNQGITNIQIESSAGGSTWTASEEIIDGVRCAKGTKTVSTAETWALYNIKIYTPSKFRANQQYAISFKMKPSFAVNNQVTRLSTITNQLLTANSDPCSLVAGEWNHVKLVVTTLSDFDTILAGRPTVHLRLSIPGNSSTGDTVLLKDIMIEEGNKASAYAQAPEDVQAEITAAKQEALTAAGNAQSTANSASSAVGNLSGYVDGAFKDGVIDTAEAKAIEKYKNTLNEAMAKAESSYLKVYTNTYLSGAPKTALQNAKINLWGQRDTLIGAINTAISGGTTTPAQKLAVDNAFTSFNSLMAAFQNALEDANKAIQVKLDDIAKGYVDDLEIGGTNLLKNTASGVGWFKTGFDAKTRTFTRETTGTSELFVALIEQTRLENNTTYTLSAWIRSNGQVKDVDYFVYSKSISKVHSKKGIAVTTNWQFVTFTFTTDSSTDYSESTIRFDNNGSKTAGVNAILYVKEPKLERGTKATDWTPSPEDVPSALDYIATAIEQVEGTTIEGGLVTTNLLMVKDTNKEIRGGMSGLEDNVGFWAGGSYQDALDSLAKVLFRKDGSGQLAGGLIKSTVDGDTQIGDVHVDAGGALLIKEGEDVRVLITKDNISTLAAIASSTQNRTENNSDYENIPFPPSGTFQQPKAITVNNNGTRLTVTGTFDLALSTPAGQRYSQATLSAQVYLRKVGDGWGTGVLLSSGSVTVNKLMGEAMTDYFSGRSLNKVATVAAGQYRIVADYTYSINGPGPNEDSYYTANLYINATSMHALYDGAYRRNEIGKNGMGVIANANNYSFFGVENGAYKIVEKTTGVYDRPGVLLAGEMGAAGGIVGDCWGHKQRTGSYKVQNNIYQINHNIGHINYYPQVTPTSDNRLWITTKATNYFRVQGSGVSFGFHFAVFGDNKD